MALTATVHAASVLTPVGGKVRLGSLDEYSIVVKANAPLTVRTAAEMLAKGLLQMSGAALPIEEGRGSRKFAFSFDATPMDCDQGYRIAAKGGNVVLSGGRRGPFYAVVALLE